MVKYPMTAEDFRKEVQNQRELKRKLEDAVRFEEGTAKSYIELAKLADTVDPQAFGVKVSAIKNEKAQHVEALKWMIRFLDKIIPMNEETIKMLREFESEK